MAKVNLQTENKSKIINRIFLSRTDNLTKIKIQKRDLIERTLAEILVAERKICRTKIDTERTVLTVRFYRISIRDLKGSWQGPNGSWQGPKGSWQGPKG